MLRVQVDYVPSSLNPLVSQDFWCHLMTLGTVFEPLVALAPSGRFQPLLASEMKVEDHGRRFRFTLRPNVTFHDGRPLTSADVQYTIEAVVKRARRYRGTLSLFHAELQQVQEVRAVDARTVELVLQRRNHLFPAVLAELPVVPSHLYHKHGLRNPRLNGAPIGTGPFKLAAEERDPGEDKRTTLTLVRSPSYWGRRPGLSRLVFTAIPDPAAALARLRNGEIDMIPNLHPSYYPDQIKGERMQRRFAAFRILPYRLRLLLFNVRPGPVKDRRARIAFAHLADRQRMLREVRNNLGQVAAVPIWPLSPWYDTSIHPYDYDRPAAARLLTAAGWKLAKQGRRLMGGSVPLHLRLLVARESPRMLQVANLLKNEIQTSGGSLEVKVGDFGYVKTRLRRGNFDLALLGLAPRPQSDLSPLLHSKGQLNLGGYKNPVVDRLLEGVRGTSREGLRMELLRQLYRALHNDPPFLVLYSPIEILVVSREVKGVAANGRRPVFSTLSR